MEGKGKDLTGMTFGRLTVLQLYITKGEPRKYLCRCSCGNESIVRSCNLTGGNTKSCGCMSIENLSRKTHGLSGTKEYVAWYNMMRRCNSKHDETYDRYGGRGIVVCDRWIDYKNFLADMGKSKSHQSIDRIDNNGNYEPSNCRWTDIKTQNRNTRNNRHITFNGETMLLTDWAERIGIDVSTLIYRIEKWTLGDALTRPKQVALTTNSKGES